MRSKKRSMHLHPAVVAVVNVRLHSAAECANATGIHLRDIVFVEACWC
jgi:hypothetical protein